MIDDRYPHIAYLGLGSNLGDRLGYLNGAVAHLAANISTGRIEASPVYESEAHLKPGQTEAPDFLNAVLRIETGLRPTELLQLCMSVEHDLGRLRESSEWLPRTIDIDILLIDDLTLTDGAPTVPHPRLHLRRFVLQPLFDLDPNLHVPPPFDAALRQLLAACEDPVDVVRVTEVIESYSAISGSGPWHPTVETLDADE